MNEENVQQLDLFNFGKDKYVITKPIRLIELFSGIGAQHKALKVLGVEFESWKTCEWAAPSIRAYNAIHIKDHTDYSFGMSKQELIDYLQGNISTDYNKPCNVAKKSEEWLRDIYNNCIATHNLMNIMNVKGSDLEIVDTDDYEYLMTYSFPCQDLSLAGTRQGMAISQAQGGTRSGLLWEVERILDELHKDQVDLPILLMENVPEVQGVGGGNLPHFLKWCEKLESLGYDNYFQILNAKDYGIPQNRRRCFMLSIPKGYAYDFPLKLPLKYKLGDFLESKVDEKYYLSQKDIERISNWKAQEKPLENALDENSELMSTLTARGAGEEHSGMKLIKETEGIEIIENNEQGYKVAKVGDGVNIASRMAHQRGNVQPGSIQTLKAQMEIGVVVDDESDSEE